MGDKELIAERLKKARKKAELKQIGGGAYGNVPQSTMSTWENGNIPGTLITLRKLAIRHGTSADFILGLTDDIQPAPRQELSEEAQRIIECMSEMSPRGRAQLIAICESIAEVDQDWQNTELMAGITAGMAGEEKIAQLDVELTLLTAQLGSRAAALRVLYKRYASVGLGRNESENLNQ